MADADNVRPIPGEAGREAEPTIITNPEWGPQQPRLRQVRRRRDRNDRGGDASAVHCQPRARIPRDFYETDFARMMLIRYHWHARIRFFSPTGTHLPAPLEQLALMSTRRTFVSALAGQYTQAQRSLQGESVGRTEFELYPGQRGAQVVRRGHGDDCTGLRGARASQQGERVCGSMLSPLTFAGQWLMLS